MDQNEQFLRAAAIGDLNKCTDALAQGAHPNAITPQGDNALHLACAFGHSHLIKPLIMSGTDPNAFNHDGLTAAHEAVINIRPLSLYQLMDSNGVDWDIRDQKGLTAHQLAQQSMQQVQQLGWAVER